MDDFLNMFLSIAHEMRHEQQYRYKPEILEEYIDGTEEGTYGDYVIHLAEIDAEAFARKFVYTVWGVKVLNDSNSRVAELIQERQEQIEIELDYNTEEHLYELWDF